MQAHGDILWPPVCPVCAIETYFLNMTHIRTQVSSVTIVSGYGLYDRAIEVRSLAEATSNLCVQTGSGAHPASCTMGTGVLSLGVKHG
jgi:hypothetical protein